MMKCPFFAFVAAGLLASLAFATPSHAGSVLATTTAALVAPAGTISADAEITYSSAPIGPITILGTTTVTVTSSSIVGDTVTINYTPVKGNQELDFTFLATPPISISADKLTGVVGPGPVGIIANVTTAAIPEPASIALLGIGMTGFLAFRRLFKRTTVA
jgi:hypothetical protein